MSLKFGVSVAMGGKSAPSSLEKAAVGRADPVVGVLARSET